MRTESLLVVTSLFAAVACGAEGGTAKPSGAGTDSGGSMGPGAPGSGANGGATAAAGASSPRGGTTGTGGSSSGGATTTPPGMPFGTGGDVYVWSTEQFSLDPGQERYLCYSKTLDQELVINAYNSEVKGFVHHLILSRVSAPETEGFSECDVAFKNSWDPIFITGAGDSTLEFPVDAGHQLHKGKQLTVQMHLLNTGDAPVMGSVTINMRRSTTANPRPVSSFIFGTAAVQLPAHATTDVVGTCSPFQQLHLIAGFPHMHLLGKSLTFSVGTSPSTLQEVFKRDPFDFGGQHIDKLDVMISPGNVTRVNCTFDNPQDQAVSYGESTKNEMCYFIGFAVNLPRQSACLEVLPPNIFGR